MPFYPSTDEGGLRTLTGEAPPTPLTPTPIETWGAAFRQDNPLVNVAGRIMAEQFPAEPGHNPMDLIRGSKYEQYHLDSFLGSNSAGQTRAIMARIDGQDGDRRILDASGQAGWIAQIAAGLLDPTTALPGAVAVKSVKGGYDVARSAMRVGAAAGAQTAAQEAVLQGTQETRTAVESAIAVGAATILGGLIGGGAAAMLSKAEREALESALDSTRAEMDAHVTGAGARAPEPPQARRGLPDGARIEPTRWEGGEDVATGAPVPQTAKKQLMIGDEVVAELNLLRRPDEIHIQSIQTFPGNKRQGYATALMDDLRREFPDQKLTTSMQTDDGAAFFRAYGDGSLGRPEPSAPPLIPESQPGLAAAAGAAATDTRKLEMESFGLDKIPVFKEVFEQRSPVSRTLSAEAVTARRVLADTFEMPYRFKENAEGVATTQGPALDRLVRMEVNGTGTRIKDDLQALFSEYRFGEPDARLPQIRAFGERVLGRDEGKMTWGEFKKAVSEAAMSSERHPIPQVAAAADMVHAKLFEPWSTRAEGAIDGFKKLEPKPGERFFPHLWNKQKIAAERPQFVNKLLDHYKQDQTRKAATQVKLQAYRNGLEVAQTQIKKLTAQIEKRTAELAEIEAKQEEATRANRFAFKRATDLRESEFRNDGGVRIDDPGKNIEKARGGAVFETQTRARGNELADRASGKDAQIEVLEARLAQEIENEAAVRARIETEIAAWEGKSASEAKSALKAREKADADRATRAADKGEALPTKRLAAADDAIDRAVDRILKSDRDISDAELRARAHETVNRILSSPDGRLPYDMPAGGPRIGVNDGPPPRGSLASRAFDVPNAWAKDWIEDDIEQIISTHLRTMVPDVLLAERHGDVEMSPAFRAINDEYAMLADAAPNKAEATRIEKERQAVIRDMAAMRDRVRSVYGWSGDMRNAARVANVVKNANNITSMGSVAITSLPDMAGVIFRHGLTNTMRDGWIPFFKSLKGSEGWDKAKHQWRAVGLGVEMSTAARQHALDDVMATYRPESKFERGLQNVTDKFFIANLLAPMTDIAKLITANVASAELLRASKAVAAGTASKKQITMLAENGIDQQMAGRVWEQFQTGGGEVIDGVHVPNTADWKDKSAAKALEGAVAREAEIAVVTPGQEKPLIMSKPVMSLLTQYKSFVASATERILVANLQRRDAAVLSGLVTSIGLGMLSYKLNEVFGGQKTSERPQDWFKEGISRSGLLGWLEEGNAFASKASRGTVDIYRMIGADKPMSRYASRSALDMLLGPTAGKIENVTKVTGALGGADWTESDTKALRRLTAFQNLFYTRRLFDQVESGFNGAFGIEMTPP
jgi:hypothetical protein